MADTIRIGDLQEPELTRIVRTRLDWATHIIDDATREGRDLTDAEEATVLDHLDTVVAAKVRRFQVHAR